MAKQKLNRKTVELIKHLLEHKRWNHHAIADFIRICGHKNIWKIAHKHRWTEVQCPNVIKGERLYYQFLEDGEL
jgi:hypothetical protein